ncbi:hypothetical protein GTH32_06905 [Alteromonas sp. 345S023]|uniref:Uncharacterized protein n=1 Tax=Alteromonas profundi TaxID=2696062 RepID=A0A7X5LKD3_9ALTE|nr:hypothetical protein [Alteromonas profundi]NDV90928.1 hypothetical protein [Alteromonas profundi]
MGNKNVSPSFKERRVKPRTKTALYRLMLILNAVGWFSLVVALVLFHYARPDFISGVQRYWGIEGDNTWAPEYVKALFMVLQLALGLALVSMVIHARRNRRRGDNMATNLFVLVAISTICLVTLVTTFDIFK